MGDTDEVNTVAYGNELLAQEQPAKALAAFDSVLQRDPRNIAARLGRVTALLRMGERQFALAGCDAILAVQPVNDEALRLKRDILMALHRYEEAICILDQQMRNAPESAALLHARETITPSGSVGGGGSGS